ncbi:MAG: pyrroline-5-carboxylate reductase [Sphingomonadaceae bacterium]|nr:pyrroline-5-carboxylate reductase [Sphingomonadaceae bacterium]
MTDLSGIGPIWLVGCGKLGQAMLAGWLKAGLRPQRVTAINPSPSELPGGVAYAPAPAPDLPRPSVIVLAVKPQKLAEAAQALGPYVESVLVVSVLAGATLSTLGERLRGARLIRALPNTAVRVGLGVTLLTAGAGATQADHDAAAALMGALGRTHQVSEADMDAASAVSASAPAFLFRFIEALGAGGRVAGLPPELADRLALETIAGSGMLALLDGRALSELRAEVTSPNGMTQAGLEVLDGTGALSTLMRDTIRAAARRSAELGREVA